MSTMVIIDGDPLQFSAQFGDSTVTPTGSLRISGSGEATIAEKKICIVGDEKKVSVAATYIKGAFTTPGKGTLTIVSLAADQQAAFATAQTPIIVRGSQFSAQFTPETPAQNPGGQPAPMTPAAGTGTFTNMQSFVTAG
ncbi:hypothetical protein [Erwinia persicina]|uniref:Uncharacterized protein n=1 Tax=Erwinia persicina TaxID=55211 RepID=A0A4V5U7V9_9GAMM|nr:hypothetical protein [Erwinia persicina]MBD8109118.1 hypothetical protein [Erwinia persicina]MBD8170104.1 hypothetical protein [Erwinia persicina]MBD8212242.1 hypothetical protein [Erwinia persicina]TKJ83637.1 hypothetical protein EpCFBP13511_22480 [Erwinia persicina]